MRTRVRAAMARSAYTATAVGQAPTSQAEATFSAATSSQPSTSQAEATCSASTTAQPSTSQSSTSEATYASDPEDFEVLNVSSSSVEILE